MDDRVAFVAEKEVEFGGPTTLVPSDTRSIQTQLRGGGREGGGGGREGERGRERGRRGKGIRVQRNKICWSDSTYRRCLGVSTTTTDILTIKSLPFCVYV